LIVKIGLFSETVLAKTEPATARMMLVLPTPLGPTISTLWPGARRRLSPLQIICSPWGVVRVRSVTSTPPSELTFLQRTTASTWYQQQ
jgi:hypothetical protein